MPNQQLMMMGAALVLILVALAVSATRRPTPMKGTLTIYRNSRTIHEILLTGGKQELDQQHASFIANVTGLKPGKDKRSRVKLTTKVAGKNKTYTFTDGQDVEIGDLVVEYQGQRNRALERITAEQPAVKPRRGVVDEA